MSSMLDNIKDTFGWRLWASIWSDLLPSSVCLALFLLPRSREWLGPFGFLVWANSFLYLLIPVNGGSMLTLLSGLTLLASMLLGAGFGVLASISSRFNAIGLVVWLAALIFVRLLARGNTQSQHPLAAFVNLTPAYAFILMATANYNPAVTLNYLGHSMCRAALITWAVHLICRFLFGYTKSTNAIMREHMSDVLEGLADMLRSTARLLVDTLDEQQWHVPASLTTSHSEPYDVEIKPKGPDNLRGKDMLQSTEITPDQDLYRSGPKAPALSTATSVELNNRAGLLRQLRFTLREAIVDMSKLEKMTKWSCRLLLNGQFSKYRQLSKVLTEACWLVMELCVYHPKNNTEQMMPQQPIPFVRTRPAKRSPPKQKEREPGIMMSPSQPPPEFVKAWGSQREVAPPKEEKAPEEGPTGADGLQYQNVRESGPAPSREIRGVDSFPVEDDLPARPSAAAGAEEDDDDDTPVARTAPTPVAESWENDRYGNYFSSWFNQLFRSSKPETPTDFRLDSFLAANGRPVAEGDEEERPVEGAAITAGPSAPTTGTDPTVKVPSAGETVAEEKGDVEVEDGDKRAAVRTSDPAEVPSSSVDAGKDVSVEDVADEATNVATPKAAASTAYAKLAEEAAAGTPKAEPATSPEGASTPESKMPTSPEELSPSGLPRRKPGRILEAVEKALKRPEDSYPPGFKPPSKVEVASDQGTPSVGTPKPPTPTFELKPTPSPQLASPESSRGLETGSMGGESPAEGVSEKPAAGKWGRADSGKSSAFGKLAAKLRSGLVGKRSTKGPKEEATLEEVKVQGDDAAQAVSQTPQDTAAPESVNIYEPAGQAPAVLSAPAAERETAVPEPEERDESGSSQQRPAAIDIPGPSDAVERDDRAVQEVDAVPPSGSMEIPMSQEMYKSIPAVNRYEPAQPQKPLHEPPSPGPPEYPEPSPSPLKPVQRSYDADDRVERNEVPRSTAATAVAGMAAGAAAVGSKKDRRGKKGRRRDFPAELAALDEDSPVDADLPEMDQMRLKERAVEAAAKPRKSRLSNKAAPPSAGKHDLKTCVATFADEVAGALDIMAALVAPVPFAGQLPPGMVDFLGPEWKLHPRQQPRRVNALAAPMPDIEHGSLSPATKQLVSQAVPGRSAEVEMVLTLRPLLKAQMQVAEKAYQRFEQQLLQALHKAGGPLKAAQSSNAEQALNVMYFFSFSRYMLNTFYPLGDAVRDFTAATSRTWSPTIKDWLHQPKDEEVIPSNWKHNTPEKSVFAQIADSLHLRSFRNNLADLRETLRMTLLIAVISAIGFGTLTGWAVPHPLYGFSSLVFVSIVMAMPWSVTGVLMAVVYMFAAWLGVLVSMIVWATASGDRYEGGTAAWFVVILAFLSFVARVLPDSATACAMGGLFLSIPVAGYMNSMPVGGPRMEEALGGWYGAPKTGFYRFASLHLAALLIAAVITVLVQLLIFPRLASRKIKDVEAAGSKELLILCTSQQLIDNELRERCYAGEFQTPAEVQEAVHLHQRGMWQLHGSFMSQLVEYNRLVQAAWEEPSFYGAFHAGVHRDLNMYMSKASNASMALCIMLLRPLLAVSAKQQVDDQMLQGFQKEVVAHPLMNGDLQRASIQLLQSLTNSLQTRSPLLLPAIAPALKFHLSRQTQGLRDAIQQLSSHARHPISVSNWNEALGRVWIEMLLLLHLNSSVELNKAIRGAARACRELHGYLLPPPPALLPTIPSAPFSAPSPPFNALYPGQSVQIVNSPNPHTRSEVQT